MPLQFWPDAPAVEVNDEVISTGTSSSKYVWMLEKGVGDGTGGTGKESRSVIVKNLITELAMARPCGVMTISAAANTKVITAATIGIVRL